jgi:hypothetical protein
MKNWTLLLVAASILSGCGLAETAATATATGASSVQEARDAKQIEANVQQQLDAAQQQAAAQREAAEKASQ